MRNLALKSWLAKEAGWTSKELNRFKVIQSFIVMTPLKTSLQRQVRDTLALCYGRCLYPSLEWDCLPRSHAINDPSSNRSENLLLGALGLQELIKASRMAKAVQAASFPVDSVKLREPSSSSTCPPHAKYAYSFAHLLHRILRLRPLPIVPINTPHDRRLTVLWL